MELLVGTPLASVILGIAATLLALSLLVQVLQELWKYLFSTQAGVYTRVLEDVLGPVARQLTRSGSLPELQARGPFQFRRMKPSGDLLPMRRADLVEGLERTASPWVRRALGVLRLETDLQQGSAAPPSAEWSRFVQEVLETESGGPYDQDRRDLQRFIKDNDLPGAGARALDAVRALRLLQERFFQHVRDADQHFDRLQELFEFQYRRRNLALTFLFGFAVAFACAQPLQTIVDRARSMSPEQVTALADRALELHEALAPDSASDSVPSRPKLDSALTAILRTIDPPRDSTAQATDTSLTYLIGGVRLFWDKSGADRTRYLFGCVLTAVLLSFGAPFWNDLVKMLAGRSRALARVPETPGKGETDA